MEKMSEFSTTLLFSDLFRLCFFIFSHPLYLSYFIFFSPYLLKLVSFLSPLFITTILLLLALLTFSPTLVHDNDVKVGFLSSMYQTVSERSRSRVADYDEKDHFEHFEELEVYKIVFDTSLFENKENPIEDLEEVVKETCSESLEASLLKETHEVQSIVFETSNFEIKENPVEDLEVGVKETCLESLQAVPVDKCSNQSDNGNGVGRKQGLIRGDLKQDPDEISDDQPKIIQPIVGVKRLKKFWQERENLENMSSKREDMEVIKTRNIESKKLEERKGKPSVRSESKAIENRIKETEVKSTDTSSRESNSISTIKVNSPRVVVGENVAGCDNGDANSFKVIEENSQETLPANLGSFGSMRKEKEWRKTLACKLFEERHNNVDGSEGMDMLWETYETEYSNNNNNNNSNKANNKSKHINTKREKKGGISSVEYKDDYDDEFDEDYADEQLCCLQALKFSAGKMNLGMRRPNLLKLSKTLKGFGWLQNVTRNSKKG